ncbi:hypothetical protein V6Z11_D04G210300 [Gossypium hirsutum]
MPPPPIEAYHGLRRHPGLRSRGRGAPTQRFLRKKVRPVNVEANVRDVRGATVGMCGGCGQMLLGFLKF